MVMFIHNRRLSRLCLAMAVMLIPALSIGAEGRAQKSGGSDINQETVEMFAAMEKGQIAVKLIPKDSTQCRVFIENKTDLGFAKANNQGIKDSWQSIFK